MPIASNYGSQFSFRRDCRVKSGSLVVPRELRSGRSTMKSYNKFFNKTRAGRNAYVYLLQRSSRQWAGGVEWGACGRAERTKPASEPF